MKIENTNERFGNAGPFEAESIDALVADYRQPGNSLCTWAAEAWMSDSSGETGKHPALPGETREQYIERIADELAEEFRDGLEIVG